ncbi:glycosyltransferase family 39 protein [Candidatus Pacearchaeota archaeon]|nr:glycosyltransferase family 39 protein [Candidatus Pacearchaeota archaeon]
MMKLFNRKITGVQSIIIFLIIVGFFLRIEDLGIQSFWMDEAISSIAAMSFLEKGSPILKSGLLYDRGILNTFLIASSFKIFGVNEFAARIPSVLFGTLTILLVYIIGSKLGDQRVGIIAAVLVAFSVWEIAWSRQARMYQQLQFFYILSLYLFYEFTKNKNRKNLVLLSFSIIATILSHVFGYVLILVFLSYLFVLTLNERRTIIIKRKTTTLFVISFVASLVIAYHTGILQTVLKTNVNYYDVYIYIFKQGMEVFLFMTVLGGRLLLKKEWKQSILLIAALIIPLYFIFFHVLLLATRYLYFILPIMFILSGYFLYYVVDYLENSFTRIGNFLRREEVYGANPKKNVHLNIFKKFKGFFNNKKSCRITTNVILFILLVLIMYNSPAFTFTPKERYDIGINAPQSNFKDGYMYVKGAMQPSDVIVSAWTPPSQFYLGKSDYWLAINVVGTGIDGFIISNTSRDIYTNATVIRNIVGLKNVMKNNTVGWIIIDNIGLYKLNPEISNYIDSETLKVFDINTIRVYMWNNTKISY